MWHWRAASPRATVAVRSRSFDPVNGQLGLIQRPLTAAPSRPSAARRSSSTTAPSVDSTRATSAASSFFGWQAVGRIALRQAPLSRPKVKAHPPKLDAAEVARVESTLGAVTDDELRAALGRLGAAVKGR